MDYDEWFVQEVEKGSAQIERGELVDHEEVGARMEEWLREKQPRTLMRIQCTRAGARDRRPLLSNSQPPLFTTCLEVG